jgi:hypothetical protein
LAGQPVEDGCDTCRAMGMRIEYATRGGSRGFGPQKPGKGSEEWTACDSIEELASRLSYLMKGAVAVRSRLCQVGLECPCG